MRFWSGVPVSDYRKLLGQAVFALCPEGDRHLDTFRLCESLELGCLPLVVERQGQAISLLGDSFPVPIFNHWCEALQFVEVCLTQPEKLDELQHHVQEWWSSTRLNLHKKIQYDLDYLNQ